MPDSQGEAFLVLQRQVFAVVQRWPSQADISTGLSELHRRATMRKVMRHRENCNHFRQAGGIRLKSSRLQRLTEVLLQFRHNASKATFYFTPEIREIQREHNKSRVKHFDGVVRNQNPSISPCFSLSDKPARTPAQNLSLTQESRAAQCRPDFAHEHRAQIDALAFNPSTAREPGLEVF